MSMGMGSDGCSRVEINSCFSQWDQDYAHLDTTGEDWRSVQVMVRKGSVTMVQCRAGGVAAQPNQSQGCPREAA